LNKYLCQTPKDDCLGTASKKLSDTLGIQKSHASRKKPSMLREVSNLARRLYPTWLSNVRDAGRKQFLFYQEVEVWWPVALGKREAVHCQEQEGRMEE